MTAEPAASQDLRALLPAAFEAADEASAMMRTRRPVTLTEKSDRDLVSDVDVAIERAIRHRLANASPGIAFLGEEEGRSGDPAAGWVWTLDPIDGTSNFAHGLPLCTTSLALLRDGRPVLAVIDAPFLGHRYHAIEGRGAYTSGPGISGTRLSVARTARLRDAVVAIGDYAVGEDADRKNEARLAVTTRLAAQVHRIRMLGTAALDLAWVAEGPAGRQRHPGQQALGHLGGGAARPGGRRLSSGHRRPPARAQLGRHHRRAARAHPRAPAAAAVSRPSRPLINR